MHAGGGSKDLPECLNSEELKHSGATCRAIFEMRNERIRDILQIAACALMY